MKTFYKKVFILLIFLGLFGIASYGLAEEENSTGLQLVWPNSPAGTKLEEGIEISQMVKYFYEWGISLGGLAVFISLIMSGFKYLTSAGNESKMREAKEKINSAFLGLLLLLSSFLILNSINPELTTLRMPDDIGSTSGNLASIDLSDEPPKISDPCEKVIAYSQANFQGNSFEILPGLISGNLDTKIEGDALSIDIYGFCKAELYSSSNCLYRSDLETTIYTSLSDISSVYIDPVFCVKNLTGNTSSPCDTTCAQCTQANCITSPANCVWQQDYYLCVESTCDTNCSECVESTLCWISQAGCTWDYDFLTCKPPEYWD